MNEIYVPFYQINGFQWIFAGVFILLFALASFVLPRYFCKTTHATNIQKNIEIKVGEDIPQISEPILKFFQFCYSTIENGKYFLFLKMKQDYKSIVFRATYISDYGVCYKTQATKINYSDAGFVLQVPTKNIYLEVLKADDFAYCNPQLFFCSKIRLNLLAAIDSLLFCISTVLIFYFSFVSIIGGKMVKQNFY